MAIVYAGQGTHMTDRSAVSAPAGVTGLQHWSGVIESEWDKRLRGKKGTQAYAEMASGSATIGALLFAFESLVRGAGYRIEPAEESDRAHAEAAFVEDCLDDLDGAWGDTLSEVLTCLTYGFALLETVYKLREGPDADEPSMYSDNRIGWARWSPRAQETIESWRFDAQGRATHAIQVAPPNWTKIEIPLARCLHVRIRARRNSPEGLSLLRNAFDSWYYYKHIQRIEAIGLERDLAGIPVARVPSDLNDTDLATWDRVVTNLRKDEQAGLRMPSDRDENGHLLYDITLLTTGGTRQIDTDPILARYERLQLRSVLFDFLTQGDTGVGSYAQNVSRTDLALSATDALLDSIADAITVQAIRRLFEVNGLPLELCPRFRFNSVTRKDLGGFVAALVSLANIGIVDASEPDLKGHVYDLFDLPLPDETDEQEAEDDGEAPDPDDEDTEGDEDDETPEGPPQRATEPHQAIEPDDITDAVALFRRAVKPEFRGLIEAEVED